MAIERITAVALPTAPPRQAPSRAAPAPAGETVRVTVDATVLDDVLASLPDGRSLRLTGLGQQARGLSAGDVLLMRVLSNGPRLELALLDALVRGAPESLSPTSQAMQYNQVAQGQLSWRAPEAAALAQAWRTMVWQHFNAGTRPLFTSTAALAAHGAAIANLNAHVGDLVATVRDAGTVVPLPASIAGGTHQAQLPLHAADRWLFPAYAWGGLHLMLRVVDPDEPPPTRRPKPRKRTLAINLEVEVPGIGWVAAQVLWLETGVQLRLFVHHPHAVEPMKEAMPALTRALAQRAVQVVHTSVVHGRPEHFPVPDRQALQGHALAQLLPPQLFHAAAQVAVLFAAWVPPDGFSPVTHPRPPDA